MNDRKHDRFRRLERPRAEGPDGEAAPTGTDTRIGAVEGPVAAPPAGAGAPASGGHLGRFRAPPERPLELDNAPDDAQPFLRCAACETDNFRDAATCTTCGADLGTEAVRLFNRRFWAARQAEAAAEAAAAATRRAALDEALARDAALRREAAESMARQVGDAERQRLEGEGLGGGRLGTGLEELLGGDRRPATPPLFRLLRSLPPGWAVPAGLALLLLPVGLYAIAPLAGLLTGAVLVVLGLPPGRRTRFGSWFGR